MKRLYLCFFAMHLAIVFCSASQAANLSLPIDTNIVETKITMDDPGDYVHADNTIRNTNTNVYRQYYDNGSGKIPVVNGSNVTFKARPVVVTTFSRKGPYALVYETPKREALSYPDLTDRMENSMSNVGVSMAASTDSIHYSAFSIYIPSGYDIVNNWFTFHQWHQSVPESPPIALYLAPGYFSRLTLKILYGINKATTYGVDVVRADDVCNCQDKFVDLPRDKWIDFVVRWKFALTDESGEVIVWKHEMDEPDATKIFEYHGKIGFTSVSNPIINEKIGIYRGQDYVSNFKIIIDEVKRGKSFNAVKAW